MLYLIGVPKKNQGIPWKVIMMKSGFVKVTQQTAAMLLKQDSDIVFSLKLSNVFRVAD